MDLKVSILYYSGKHIGCDTVLWIVEVSYFVFLEKCISRFSPIPSTSFQLPLWKEFNDRERFYLGTSCKACLSASLANDPVCLVLIQLFFSRVWEIFYGTFANHGLKFQNLGPEDEEKNFQMAYIRFYRKPFLFWKQKQIMLLCP